ncbi:MAG: type II toxin-antitoxin system RelE/ParE family toxin [Gammaproteobacteria bacterium]|nr:MAG: type II toxin-antitoxin system RelE/ParE family toxin [Gammaproteobacteria bacterium]
MTCEIFLTDDALRDLEEIDDYICTADSPQKADYVLQKIESTFQSLADLPMRGSHPKELLQLGIQDYREIYFKPYRIIYRPETRRVYVYLIADGRRDMQSLLGRRLLGA